MKLVELIRIREDSDIFNSANHPSSEVNRGERKEQRILESTSLKDKNAKFKKHELTHISQ